MRELLWQARQRIGSRYDIGFLLYGRGVFESFDELGKRDAPVIARAIDSLFPDVESITDVGSGTGRLVAELRKLGKTAEGVERSRIARQMALERSDVELAPFDLRLRPTPIHADLACSFEVAEHIPRWLSRRFVRFLAACGPIVLFSAARPHEGSGGIGHVNEQPRSYWVDRFAEIGLREVEAFADAFRQSLPLQEISEHWAETNLFVFRSTL